MFTQFINSKQNCVYQLSFIPLCLSILDPPNPVVRGTVKYMDISGIVIYLDIHYTRDSFIPGYTRDSYIPGYKRDSYISGNKRDSIIVIYPDVKGKVDPVK